MPQTASSNRCPNRAAWSGFYTGQVSTDVLDVLVEHLDQCATCQGVLNELAGETAGEGDALLAGLRGAGSGGPGVYENEPACRRAVARALALAPGTRGDEGQHTAVPPQLGEYQVFELLGRGGMGAVYRAVHLRLGREVALKVVPPERALGAETVRFRREVSAHGKLDHPNVVRATDAGEANGIAFLVMDLVDGIDLNRLVGAAGPLSVADACELVRQAAVGLHHLSGHGLVHRDVKPSNLMLDRAGTVKVLDLGLAACTALDLWNGVDASEADTALTSAGQILGTFDFLAPEQADPSGPVDARADVYGLGCSLYFLLTGTAPYAAHTTARSKVLAHTAAPVPHVRGARPDVPAALSRLLARMLAKNPGERFPTASAVADALAPFCVGADLATLLRRAGVEPLPPGRAPRRRRRLRTRFVAATLFGLTLAGVASANLWGRPSEPERASGHRPPTEGARTVDLPEPKEDPKEKGLQAKGQKQDVPEPAPRRRVLPLAVLNFSERGPGTKDFGAKVSDLLFAKLSSKPALFLVDRSDLTKVLDEQALGRTGAVRSDEAARVGRLTGAQLLVTGSVLQVDKRVHLVAKVIGVETGRVAGASVEGASSDDLGELVGRLADAVGRVTAEQGERLVPKRAPVADRGAALAARLGGGARPVLSVRVSERHIGQPTADPAAQTEVVALARSAGFEVVDTAQAGAGAADVLVTGEGFSEVAGRVGSLVSVRARVELKAVDRRTGKVLAAGRGTAVVVDLAEQVAGKAALQGAAAELAERVLAEVATAQQKK